MAKKKSGLSNLLNKTLGLDNEVTLSTEELLDVVSDKKVTVNTVIEEINNNVASISVSSPEKEIREAEEAYNVTYDSSTKRYSLVTVSYFNDGTCKIKTEVFAEVLPEVNYKIGKIFLDKLKYSLYTK